MIAKTQHISHTSELINVLSNNTFSRSDLQEWKILGWGKNGISQHLRDIAPYTCFSRSLGGKTRVDSCCPEIWRETWEEMDWNMTGFCSTRQTGMTCEWQNNAILFFCRLKKGFLRIKRSRVSSDCASAKSGCLYSRGLAVSRNIHLLHNQMIILHCSTLKSLFNFRRKRYNLMLS